MAALNPASVNLALQLALTLAHAIANSQVVRERVAALVGQAQAEGRQITLEELRGLAAETDAKLDALEAALLAAAAEDPPG